MSLIDDLLELGRPELQDLCRTQEVQDQPECRSTCARLRCSRAIEPELILIWWVNRELDGP